MAEEDGKFAHGLRQWRRLTEEGEGAILNEEDLGQERGLDFEERLDDVDEHNLLEGGHHVTRDAAGTLFLIDPLVEAQRIDEKQRATAASARAPVGRAGLEDDAPRRTPVVGALGNLP